jgi:hypothetical protein
MKAKIYINRHIIQANKKATKETGIIHDAPAIAIRTYKNVFYTKKIEFTQPVRLVQDASKAICSGATVWLETEFEGLIFS